jgi:predicted Zn finger-like uncharacterized protein
MDFHCDGCGREYRISDDKVRGKTLHVRCKKCQRAIVLTGRPTGATEPVPSGPRFRPALVKARFDERVKPAFEKLDSMLAADYVDAGFVHQWLEHFVKEVRELDEIVAKLDKQRPNAGQAQTEPPRRWRAV